jgi:hypothetical protein
VDCDCEIAAALPFPDDRSVEWVARTASTYSGGTAPASDRLPFYARLGTEGTYSVFSRAAVAIILGAAFVSSSRSLVHHRTDGEGGKKLL